LKAICTFTVWQGMEDCRKCCGGNGFLLCSGIAAQVLDYVWQTTAEGDFIVLLLQTVRMLVKSLQGTKKGETVASVCDYMLALKDPKFDLEKASPPQAKSPKEFKNLDYLLALFKHRALVAVVSANEDLDAKLASGMSFGDAWNSCAVDLCAMVWAHSWYFILGKFLHGVKNTTDAPIQAVLAKLCIVFACSNFRDENWLGLLDRKQLRFANTVLAETLDSLRPDAVPLVDSFDIPDRVLNSAIGRSDGNVYEALFEAAKKSPLNRQDPIEGYDEYLRSHLDQAYLAYGNRPASKL